MTKYSTKKKIEIVSKYLNGENSLNGLAQEYGLDYGLINRWVNLAKAQGLTALKVRHIKQFHSTQFKLKRSNVYESLKTNRH